MTSSPLPAAALGDIVRRLGEIPLFASLTDDARRAIAARSSLVELPVGGQVFAEGEETTQFYVLLSGEASVSVALGEGGEPVEVGTVSAGETLGEMGPLLGGTRAASVHATRPCR